MYICQACCLAFPAWVTGRASVPGCSRDIMPWGPKCLVLLSSYAASLQNYPSVPLVWFNFHPPFTLPGSPLICWKKPDVSSLFRIKKVDVLKPVPYKSWLFMTLLGLVPWQWCFLQVLFLSQIVYLLSFFGSPCASGKWQDSQDFPLNHFLKSVFHFQASCHPANIHRLQCLFNSGT